MNQVSLGVALVCAILLAGHEAARRNVCKRLGARCVGRTRVRICTVLYKYPVIERCRGPNSYCKNGFCVRSPGAAEFGRWDSEDTCHYANGWKISHCSGSFEWIESSEGKVPPGAVEGGVDLHTKPLYVGRAWHEGDLLPAKVAPAHGCAFVAFHGKEFIKEKYEVLVSKDVDWIPTHTRDDIPLEAIPAGHTKEGEPLYVGRCNHSTTLTIGKVNPTDGILYIPWEEKEVTCTDFQIMVPVYREPPRPNK